MRRLFEVNSEPHTGARPSVRLCLGLNTLPKAKNQAKDKRAKNRFKAEDLDHYCGSVYWQTIFFLSPMRPEMKSIATNYKPDADSDLSYDFKKMLESPQQVASWPLRLPCSSGNPTEG